LGFAVHQYRSVRGEAASAREELRASELEASSLRASLAERKVCPMPPPVDTQLTQTLQVLASEQQMLLFQSLHPVDLNQPATPSKASRAQARRSPRRRRRIASCSQP
jgi:hypothetical protein